MYSDGQPVKAQKSGKVLVEEDVSNAPISPINTPQVEFETKEATPDLHRTDLHHTDGMAEPDEEESARILAEFKVCDLFI